LDRPGQHERFLKQVRGVGSAEALDGDYLRAIEVSRLSETGTHGLTVEDDGTSPALSLAIAGLFGPGQSQVLPQYFEKHGVLAHHQLAPNAVHMEPDFPHNISSPESDLGCAVLMTPSCCSACRQKGSRSNL